MSTICGSRTRKKSLKQDENIFPKCKFKLQYPRVVPEDDFSPIPRRTLSPIKGKDTQNPKGKLKFQCHYEERKRKAESRRKKILQKLKKVYKINVDDLNENVTNEIIMKVEILEREKREREKRNIERNLIMINRLLEEQKYKRRGLKQIVPPWRKPLKNVSVCMEIEEEEFIGEDEEKSTKTSNLGEQESKERVTSQSEIQKKEEPSRIFSAEEKTPVVEETSKDILQEEDKAKLPRCPERKMSQEPSSDAFRALVRPKCTTPAPLEKYLECSPKKVIFQDYEKGKVYLQDLRITNTGSEMIHCRYLGIVIHEKGKEKFPIGVAVRDNVKLRPGLSCSTKVRLCSEDAGQELECSIVYETRRQRKPLHHSLFFVPVVCLPSRAIIKVTPLKMIFPSLTWCVATGPEGEKQLKKILKIENSGGKPCSCRIFKYIAPEESIGEEMYGECEEEEGTPKTVSSKIWPGSMASTVQIEEKKYEINYGEDGFVNYGEIVEVAESLVNEMFENVFATFRFSEKYFVEIPEFSTQQIEIRFIPHYKGFHHEKYVLQFDGCHNLEEETIELVGDIKKLPLRAEPDMIDLKTCIANSGVYSGTFRVHNESKGPYSVKLKIPFSIRNHAHVYPRMTTIQPLTCFEFSVRVYPRVTLARDAPQYYKEDSQILEFPIFVHSTNIGACKLDYTKIYVFALITNYSLELCPPEINFGTVTTLETVTVDLELTNHSLALQEYGFLNLPKGVRVEPNMGFGSILPKESIALHLLYSPGTDLIKSGQVEEIHSFNVRVTSVAECGGFNEKLEPDEEPEKLFECLWGEDCDDVLATPKQNSLSNMFEGPFLGEESEDYGSCDESSSVEGEELGIRKLEQETKIREFLSQDRDQVSEFSFYKKINLEAKDYDVTQSPSLAHNQKNEEKTQKSFSFLGEAYESRDYLESRPSRWDMQVVKCEALVILPRCQISESVIQLPATPCSSFSLYRFRLNGMNESIDADCVCGLKSSIKKSHLCEGKPKFEGSFEFQYFCPHIKLEPQSGYIKAGDSIPITIIFRPEFPPEQLRHESRIQKAEKVIKEKKSEREAMGQKSNMSTKSKQGASRASRKSSELQGVDIDEIINVSLYELEKYDLFAGERSLQELINSFYVETTIQCVIKTSSCKDPKIRTEVHQILLICPAIKPHFIYLGNSQEINFNKVFVGTRPKILLEIQNISFQRISPSISLLNPVGPFSCPAAFRQVEVDPEHIWRQPLTFAPTEARGIEREYFEVYYGPTNIFLTVCGEGIEPQYKMTPEFSCCQIEGRPGGTEELKLEFENFSPITLKIQMKGERTKEGAEVTKEEEPEQTGEVKGKKTKSSQMEDTKDKKKSKNTQGETKNLRLFDETPEEVLTELKTFINSAEEVFAVVGGDEDNEVAIAPYGKAALKIRFTPPSNKGDKKYAVKYKLMLEKISPLKEMIVIGGVSSGR